MSFLNHFQITKEGSNSNAQEKMSAEPLSPYLDNFMINPEGATSEPQATTQTQPSPGNDFNVGDAAEGDSERPIPVQGGENRSIEIFFGKFPSFHVFHQTLCDHGVTTPGAETPTKVKPESIKKLVLVGHPMTTFAGINRFHKLQEAWVTSCKVEEGLASDFFGMTPLHKLYLYNCRLEKLEPLDFPNLKVLWVSGNRLQTLNFLGSGLPALVELNAAQNGISCLMEEQLFKCKNLQILNLSGNPLCTVQDVQAVKVLVRLHHLSLSDPMYGKCPVAAVCDGRAMLLSTITNIVSLDGKNVSNGELSTIQEYVNSRALYYYANSVLAVANQAALRKSSITKTYKSMEGIGERLVELLALSAQYRRAIDSIESLQGFTNSRTLLREQLVRIEARANKLRELAAGSHKRLETIMQISRWEQEVEKWIQWIEFQSYGNTQCQILQSVHGPKVEDTIASQLNTCIFNLVSSLTCTNLWPISAMTKVETVIVIRDKGMEYGLEATFDEYYAKKDEPVYVPPPSEPQQQHPPEPLRSQNVPFGVPGYLQHQYQSQNPLSHYASAPSPPPHVTTYTKPDYKPPPPAHSFPDSVPGLPERMEPIFMFLACPPGSANNPLIYLHRILTEKSKYSKDIRVTNCLWLAMGQSKPVANSFSVVVVVKVLAECLQAIQCDKRIQAQHSWDCTCFCLKRPLAMTPAYILNISFTHEEKHIQWHKVVSRDEDILVPAKQALTILAGKVNTHKFAVGTKWRSKKSPFVRKICDGVYADLSAVKLQVAKDGSVEPLDPLITSTDPTVPQPILDVQSISRFIGMDDSQHLSVLDLSGNKLGLIVGLQGLSLLKKLNLSHNNITTLTGLHKLPSLIEFKVGWNSLRFLHANADVLSWVAPRLMTLEILPNPFQDIRDYAHIPVLLRRLLPVLHRVDIWTAPFNIPSPLDKFCPPMVADAGFSHVAMAKSWVGTAHCYGELSSHCLTDLTTLPVKPPFPEGLGSSGMDLNLSDNYLNSLSLVQSRLTQCIEWKTCLVKLQLQENMIFSLDWLKECCFPNIQILNLSCNYLTGVDLLPPSFPALRYLQLSGNPLACDIALLAPIRQLTHLRMLDCSNSPLATHPDYALCVSKFLPKVQILDGIPMSNWDMNESVERLGGNLTQDWLEEKLGHRNFNSLTQLSCPNANLQKISLSSQSLQKLISLDLQDNVLSSFTNLTSLPGLRVLCVSHNSINSLGSQPCPVCFAHTAEAQAKLRRLMPQKPPTLLPESSDGIGKNLKGSTNNVSNVSVPVRRSKLLFPKLEVLILSHNGLDALSDLHLHSMPTLRTVILNCNNISSLQGLSDLPTLKALVLDHNKIKEVSPDAFTGCNSLRYLHLEHNRITALPRLPHLPNLNSLFLSYNKIQCLTDLTKITSTGVTEMSLIGNPFSQRSDYRINTSARLPHLTTLDGFDLATEKALLNELVAKWYKPREYASYDPVFRTKSKDKTVKGQDGKLGLKVRSLSPRLAAATGSPRSFQSFSGTAGFKPLPPVFR